jgi:diguanylate cyclase (GGDEF)-like protein
MTADNEALRATSTSDLSRADPGSSWLTVLSLIAALGLGAVCGLMLWDFRNDTWQKAERTGRNLVQVLEKDISRTIELYDLSLQAVVDGLNRDEVSQASPEIRQLILFDRSAGGRDLGPILVLDAKGAVTMQSVPYPAADYAESEALQHHRADPGLGLFVSKPFTAPSGVQVIGLSRRLSGPNGAFQGIVMGNIRLSYFRTLFQGLDVGERGSINLIRSDGTILMRDRHLEEMLGRSVRGGPVFEHMARERKGLFVGKATLDNVDRLYAFTYLEDVPVLLNVAFSVDDIYAAWRRKAAVISAVVLVLCGTIMSLMVRLRSELSRRAAAERRASAAAAKLAEMANTDALTEMFNRRRFDEVMAQEWQRSRRLGLPLALLLIDADFFKAYNDRFGHQGGDAALKLIAGAIRGAVRRPSDLACRIGGEEFAVLLPGTSRDGAMVVAEMIRQSVIAAAIDHPDAPAGQLTVSIGAAQIDRAQEESWEVFVGSADVALYAAKARGRNNVSAAWSGRRQPVVAAAA